MLLSERSNFKEGFYGLGVDSYRFSPFNLHGCQEHEIWDMWGAMQNHVKIFPQWFLDPHNTRKQCQQKRLPNVFTFNLHGCQESFIVYNWRKLGFTCGGPCKTMLISSHKDTWKHITQVNIQKHVMYTVAQPNTREEPMSTPNEWEGSILKCRSRTSKDLTFLATLVNDQMVLGCPRFVSKLTPSPCTWVVIGLRLVMYWATLWH